MTKILYFILAFIASIVVLASNVEAVARQTNQPITATEEPVKDTLVPAGGTKIEVEYPTSVYVPGSPVLASPEVFVTSGDLSGNGVIFTPIDLEGIGAYQLQSGESFVYLEKALKNVGIVVSYDTFHNADVAEYISTKEESLNFFLVQGSEATAKENLAKWCRSPLSGAVLCVSSE